MTGDSARRFESDGTEALDFAQHGVLVICPKCGKCARAIETGAGHSWRRTFTCTHCGAAERRDERALSGPDHQCLTNPRGFPHLAGFAEYEPYLQTAFRQYTVWALNTQHLAWMRRYVAADLRQRTSQRASGWSNQSMQSRLPRWMVVATNRRGVLRAIGRLESMLPD